MPKSRILILEDEALIAMDVRETLEREGFEVIGPFDRVMPAMVAVAGIPIDGAILDVAIGTEQAYEVAEALSAANIPFVWATAYQRAELPPQYRGRPCLQKPFDTAELTSTLRRALDGTSRAA
jgi:DNA-binding response OmpR family regulator